MFLMAGRPVRILLTTGEAAELQLLQSGFMPNHDQLRCCLINTARAWTGNSSSADGCGHSY